MEGWSGACFDSRRRAHVLKANPATARGEEGVVNQGMSKRQTPDPVSRDREVTLDAGKTRPKSPLEALEPARAPSRPRRKYREPSRRMSGFARFISGVMTLALAAMILLGGGALWFVHEFEKPGPLTVSRTFGVPRGEGPIEIAAQLERDGIIANRWVFVAGHYTRAAMSRGKPQHLKAGEYEFKKGASVAQVHATLVEGKSILSKITLPEGLTSAQIVERITAHEDLDGEITDIPPEGTLLPDTYRFSKGMRRQELIDRMRAEQERFLAAAWEKRQPGLPVATPQEALILASIVEKETGRADERERVAAVFVNRLKKNMRLQSDPTIIYGLVGGQGSLGRPITRSDIDGKTSHNTYQINGLPPTPICNPGRSAIDATLNPAKTDDLYFVADGSGGHAFSATLKEHNAAVANWRRVERSARKEAEEGAAAAPEAAPIPVAAGTRAVSIPAPPPASATAAGKDGKPALPTVTTLNSPAPDAGTEASDPAGKLAPEKVPLPVRRPKR